MIGSVLLIYIQCDDAHVRCQVLPYYAFSLFSSQTDSMNTIGFFVFFLLLSSGLTILEQFISSVFKFSKAILERVLMFLSM